MARKPGTPSYSTEQVAELKDASSIAEAFAAVSRQLSEVAKAGTTALDDPPAQRERLDSFLQGIANVRDDYANLERALAEYAMHRQNYTQRTAAKELRVSSTTTSRWSQRPIYFERHNSVEESAE